jgi:hypothetical protein
MPDDMQGGSLRPQTFDDLVALVLRNSERLDLLEEQLRRLQEWIAAYPPTEAREAWSGLVRTAIDEYRVTAEKALKELATAIHEEMAALKSGMTLGAEEAIADLATTIQLDVEMHKRTQATQATLLERIQEIAAAQEQGASFDAMQQKMVDTYKEVWAETKADAEAQRAAEAARRQKRAQDEAREKAARLAREHARTAQRDRLYRLAQSLAVPILMSAIGTPLALLTSISNTLPQRDVVGLSIIIFVLGCGFSLYWGVIRRPPVTEDTEERVADILPSPEPEPADGAPVPPISSVTTTTTTSVATSTSTPAPAREETPP